MRKFLKDWGKQILAVLSILLMVAFFLPSGMKQAGYGGNNPVVGYLGKEKLYGQEKYYAKQDWDLLQKVRVPFSGQPLVATLLAHPRLPIEVAAMGGLRLNSGYYAMGQIAAHPDLFPLLLKEAQRMGVVVSKDEVESVLNNYVGKIEDEDRADQMRRAISELLMVRGAVAQAAGVVKVSEPMKRDYLAGLYQGISVNLVEFDASKFKDKVPAPTTQQLAEQFDKYKEIVKGNTDPKTNPFGFGYKYPNRVKLQYIQIPRGEVRRVVEEAPKLRGEPQRWDVEAYKYYSTHQGQFATTQPASTQPANQAFSLETQKKSPTTRPFDEVKADIRNQLIEAEADKLQAQIYEKISATLGADYMAYKNAAGQGGTTQASTTTTAPAPAVASSLKVPYGGFDYLKALAAQIQSQTKVLPAVHSLSDRYVTPEEASHIPGLGEARVGQEDLGTFLENSVAAFVSAARNQEGGLLHRMQPSSPLRDMLGNIYIMRVTDADPTHVPPSVAEVQDQVRADWVTSQAYQLAKSPADKLLGEAKVNGLKSAAQQSGLSAITTGVFMNRPNAQIGNYTVPDDGKNQFIEGAFKLLSTPPAHPGAQPIRVVEMPAIGKLAVTELASTAPLWNQQNKFAVADQAASELAQEQVRMFMQSWFDWNSAVARLEYKPVEQEQNKDEDNHPLPHEQPVF
jgi:hypothetical protein